MSKAFCQTRLLLIIVLTVISGAASTVTAAPARDNAAVVWNDVATRAFLPTQGADPRTGTPEEFAATMANDVKKWAKVVAAAGIKPQ